MKDKHRIYSLSLFLTLYNCWKVNCPHEKKHLLSNHYAEMYSKMYFLLINDYIRMDSQTFENQIPAVFSKNNIV